MSAIASLYKGVEAIKAGQLEEGGRLLRYALRDESIQGELRATGLTWLADTVAESGGKVELYEQALAADSSYSLAQQRLARLLQPGQTDRQPPPPPTTLPESQPPPPPPVYQSPQARQLQPVRPATTPEMPATSAQANQLYPVVGVIVGERRGSGFFIDTSGLIATTRHVVGSQEYVTVELEPGRQLEAQVVRSFPDIDVALVNSQAAVSDLLPFSPDTSIPENTPITITAYQSAPVSGRRRETGRAMAPHLFPTDIIHIPDAGGAPVFDQRQVLVGMITRNISSSSAHVYGVHLAAIRRCVDIWQSELQVNSNRVYCGSCGTASIAGASGGYYCETCGTILPHAQTGERHLSPQMNVLYGENYMSPCSNCGARVGFHGGRCLRCGQTGTLAQAVRY